jgi:flavin-dependent thymidylate synthase
MAADNQFKRFPLDPNDVKMINYSDYKNKGYDLLVVNAAKVSMGEESQKFTRIGEARPSNEGLINYLADPHKDGSYEGSHFTPFTHVQYIFHIIMPIETFIKRVNDSQMNQVTRIILDDNCKSFINKKYEYNNSMRLVSFLERGSLYHFIKMGELHPYIVQTSPYSIKSFNKDYWKQMRNTNTNDSETILNPYNMELVNEYFSNYERENNMEMLNLNKYFEQPEEYNLMEHLSEYNLTRKQYLDMIPATFRINMPIYIARQMYKHCANFIYNEISRRYVDVEPRYYVATEWRQRGATIKQGSLNETIENNDSVINLVEEHSQANMELYKKLLNEGVCPEQARSVLFQSMETQFYMTGPLSAFDRMINLRTKSNAQKEIRDYAEAIKNILKNTIHNRVLEY